MTSSTTTATIPRGAFLVWGAGLLAYVIAVLQRTSLGVAGISAAERFDASASALATFAVLQLLVYASLQIPVGVALDRFGSKRLIVLGGLVMSAGQALLAVSTTMPGAITARVLVGAGDAMTFVCVLRLVVAWFPARLNPLMTQLTGLTGQLGQILSAIPLVWLLHGPGWTPTYLVAATAGVVVTVLAFAFVRDTPPGSGPLRRSPSMHEVRRQLVAAFGHPGTRLGLFTHFTTQFSGTVFALLWGFPFLVSGEGQSPRVASALMTVFVLAAIAAGPIFGRLVARHPLRRSWLVLGIVAITVVAWTSVLAWPGRAPLWLLLFLVGALAIGGPGSMIGFDFARTFNPAARLGSATGIVNIGGFVASLLTILGVGLVLDAVSPAGGGAGRAATYDLSSFKLAWCVQYVIWGFGVTGILVTRRKVRRRLAQSGVVVPPIREAIARRRGRPRH
ncbi:MFS transporter [Angustibacter sp. McL0619]|uniref:MFS transporter n=1 Tax=Angustibacter sp. McL0619 TaxID=3415676 RepID=UPI003CF3CD3A